MGKFFKPVKIDKKRIPERSADSIIREASAMASGQYGTTAGNSQPQRSPDFIGDWIKD